jgi:hypothetical protein
MSVRGERDSREVEETLRALRRAAKRALELGLQTGTPVHVWKDGKIVDITKEQRPSKKSRSKKTKSKPASRKS